MRVNFTGNKIENNIRFDGIKMVSVNLSGQWTADWDERFYFVRS